MGMNQNRSKEIKVRCTPQEKDKIQEIAEKQGRSLSSYGRYRMLKPAIEEVKQE